MAKIAELAIARARRNRSGDRFCGDEPTDDGLHEEARDLEFRRNRVREGRRHIRDDQRQPAHHEESVDPARDARLVLAQRFRGVDPQDSVLLREGVPDVPEPRTEDHRRDQYLESQIHPGPVQAYDRERAGGDAGSYQIRRCEKRRPEDQGCVDESPAVAREDFAVEVRVAQRVVAVDESDRDHEDVVGEVVDRILWACEDQRKQHPEPAEMVGRHVDCGTDVPRVHPLSGRRNPEDLSELTRETGLFGPLGCRRAGGFTH